MLSLATPLWLLALPLPWLAWYLGQRFKRQTTPALIHPQTAVLIQLQSQINAKRLRLPWLWLSACALFILALARPQWSSAEHEARNFMLAIDVSGSMRAMDFSLRGERVSRLDMLKNIVDRFLEHRQGDRVGVVIFADDVYTLAPLTTDLTLLRRFIGDIKQGMAGEKTALGQAIAIGVKRLQQHDKKSRALILLTDGSNTAGQVTPEAALLMAQQEGVRIYSVGIGSHGKVYFPRGPVEQPDFKEVPLDETVLKKLATQTGGRYYRASLSNELEKIITDVEQQETILINSSRMQVKEGYLIPLLLGLFCWMAALWRGKNKVSP